MIIWEIFVFLRVLHIVAISRLSNLTAYFDSAFALPVLRVEGGFWRGAVGGVRIESILKFIVPPTEKREHRK